jgi:glycosyltransferase involved in cell wall biosynthesis
LAQRHHGSVARILVLNNYDLGTAWREVAAGRAPDHVLYGLNHFHARGHEVRVVPYERSSWLRRGGELLRRFPIPLGDLDQQASVLRLAGDADLIYCPSQNVAQALGYLRALRAFDRPIVWVVHHPLDRGRLSGPRRPVMRALLRGVDAYPALSASVAEELAAIAGTSERTTWLRWGPDPDWYPQAGDAGRGVVAAGRTNRDFVTFARGASLTDVPTRIVCPERFRPRGPWGTNIEMTSNANGTALAHADLVELYAKARAVAIPLHVRWPWSVNGLQSLMDALGVGKPIIATRNPWIDLDIEQLGIGIWVDPGDVRGWRDAIRALDRRPELALEMGRRARALVDSGERSSRTFADQLMAIFHGVLSG